MVAAGAVATRLQLESAAYTEDALSMLRVMRQWAKWPMLNNAPARNQSVFFDNMLG